MPINQNTTNLGHLERRKAGRLRCAQTSCQLGQIGDLSREGCRLISKKPLKIPEGSSVNLRIEVGGVVVVVAATPVSCRKGGDGKYNIGFRFLGLTEDGSRALMALARCATPSVEHLLRLSA